MYNVLSIAESKGIFIKTSFIVHALSQSSLQAHTHGLRIVHNTGSECRRLDSLMYCSCFYLTQTVRILASLLQDTL